MSKKQILISAMMMALSAACITTYAKEDTHAAAATATATETAGIQVADANSADKPGKRKRLSQKLREKKAAEPTKN
jgi:hypothetical protein